MTRRRAPWIDWELAKEVLAVLLCIAAIAASLVVLVSPAPSHAAAAGRVLVVRPYDAPDPLGLDQQGQYVVTVLQKLGANVDVVSAMALNETQAASGSVTIAGRTTTYDAVIFLWFGYNLTNPPAGGCKPVNLLNYNTWPQIPALFFGACAGNSAQWGSQGSTDSLTGVYGPTLPPGSQPPRGAIAVYPVGYDDVTRSAYQAAVVSKSGGNSVAGGIMRVVLGWGAASGNNASCPDCDHVANRQTFPDSTVLWARYRSRLETKPMIFAYLGNGANTFSSNVCLAAIAMLDSAAGGRLLDPDKVPLKQSIVIRNAFSRGLDTNVAFTTAGGGSRPDDSTNVKASIDSLATLKDLKGNAVPITIGVNLDSVQTYLGEKAWWAKLPNAWYTGQSFTGVISGAPGTNASKHRLVDVFGRRRVRSFLPPNATGFPVSCPASDSSLACLLIAQGARIDSIWPGRQDHALIPPLDCVLSSPQLLAKEDSLHWVMWNTRYRAYVVSADEAVGNAGFRWDAVNGPANKAVPAQFPSINPHAAPVYRTPGGADAMVIDRVNILGSRGWDTDGGTGYSRTHDFKNESEWGLISGQWYQSKIMFYYHSFEASTPVFQVLAATLGGTQRPGWFQIKGLVMDARIVNRLAYPGRTLLQFVKMEDLP